MPVFPLHSAHPCHSKGPATTDDEKAIRDLITRWLAASKANDLDAILNMMDDDVVFTVAGRKPFGKEEFAANSRARTGVDVDGVSEIVELKVLGDWAWLRNRLRVTIAARGKPPVVHSGYTLTILRKKPDGRWVISRDANLLTVENQTK